MVAINQINGSMGQQTGKGFAVAGVVISIVFLVLTLIYFITVGALVGSMSQF